MDHRLIGPGGGKGERGRPRRTEMEGRGEKIPQVSNFSAGETTRFFLNQCTLGPRKFLDPDTLGASGSAISTQRELSAWKIGGDLSDLKNS